MEYLVTAILTFILSWVIINIGKREKIRSFSKPIYTQSSIHETIKDFIPKNLYEKPAIISQSMKHVEKHMVKIIIIDNKAYWVKDNIFYVAETEYGNIIPETAEPVDITNMPKTELDKMLFILDNLDRGQNKDDSGSSRNE
jgi:type III secretion system FlhB-like substrate exporter